MGNQALQVNGMLSTHWLHANRNLTSFTDDAVSNAHAHIAITVRGSDWYWTVTAIMITATIAFIGLAATKPRQKRIFHYITAAITMVASIAYFSMASNLGWTGIAVEFVRNNPKVAGQYREIFYGKSRYRCNQSWHVLTFLSPLH